MPATDGTWRVEWRRGQRDWPIGHAVAASAVIGLVLGAFLAVRRGMGAIASPLPPLPLVATAAGIVAWMLCIRLAWRSEFTRWLPWLTVALFAVACSYPGDRWIDWVVWAPAIVAAGWFSIPLRPARRSSPASGSAVISDQLLQQLTRYRTAEGHETIRGTLVAEFAAGERSATLHVAFCPPFERLPHVDVNISDDSSASVNVAQRLHNGVQLDVRLPHESDRKQTATIEIFALEPDPADAPGQSLAV